jgi:SP family general alpha glucoside:H+ symporter-like MFS transporter
MSHTDLPIQAGSCFLCVIYAYFRVPEPSGRSFAELDLLFEKGVSARKFAKAEVDVFADAVGGEALERYEKQRQATHLEKAGYV